MKPPHEWAAIGLARKLDGFSLERFVAEVQADAQSETPTLRDYFAMQAMCGWLADSDAPSHPDEVAEGAYQYADAMLAERQKTPAEGEER